jgi:signal transduction histidine kinase
VSAPAAGAAVHLSWLTPRTASLVELARGTVSSSWNQLRTDPGFLLLLLRASKPEAERSEASGWSALEIALNHLSDPVGPIDWTDSALAPSYRTGLACAHLAADLAHSIRPECIDQAWAAGLLAPLGWYAVAAVNPAAAGACLANGAPEGYQQHLWGLDQAGITRRLCRSWQLPAWLAAVIGRLDLTPQAAHNLGADLTLFCIVQLAVALVQEAGSPLRLRPGVDTDANACELGISEEQRQALDARARSVLTTPTTAPWNAAGNDPLLRELLLLALENRRLAEAPVLRMLEADTDALHHALRVQHATEEERLKARKLSALAEFAAGAGHEINNPLAVISGQAQYLLNQEAEPARQKSLHTIVGQAQRIHQILADLMQFARPARPQPQAVRVSELVGAVAMKLQPFADQRRVRLSAPQGETVEALLADPRQAQLALAALVRNGLEAAPAEGTVQIRTDASAEWIDFVVEDTGPGPATGQIEHLFDPFYSGRQAGRGRGLGLPTAWQLARVNQGSVNFAGHADGVTRFVLRLPRHADLPLVPPATADSHSIQVNLPSVAADVRHVNGHLPPISASE